MEELFANHTLDEFFNHFSQKFKLTTREGQILKFLCITGQSNREMGLKLNVSEKTVRNHIQHIHDRTKTKSKNELQALIFREAVNKVPLFSA